MKVYNENKTKVLETYDLELGYLKYDKIIYIFFVNNKTIVN